MIQPAEEQFPSSSNKNIIAKYKTKFPLTFSLLLSAITLGFIFLIVYYFNYQKKAITTDIKKDLSVISDFKVKQITNWRTERLLDGQLIAENKILVNSLRLFSQKNTDLILKNNVEQWLKTLCSKHKYMSARLVDSSGNIFSSYPEDADIVGRKGLQHILEANNLGETYLSDFHFYENTEKIHLDLVIPIKSDFEKRVNEFLMLEIDPDEYL